MPIIHTRNSATGAAPRVVRRGKKNTIPESISQNPALLEAIRNVCATSKTPFFQLVLNHPPFLQLPENYNFEILKTVWRIQSVQCLCDVYLPC